MVDSHSSLSSVGAPVVCVTGEGVVKYWGEYEYDITLVNASKGSINVAMTVTCYFTVVLVALWVLVLDAM